MDATVTPFGTRSDGAGVDAIRLDNGTLRCTVLTHGAVLQSLYLAGHDHSLTLGAADIAGYEGDMAYFGAIIAPVANRIAGARAVIAGQTYRFQANEGPNTLHSGRTGAQHALWRIADAGPTHAALTLDLAHGTGGFPGNRRIRATWRLKGAALILDIAATTDAPTLMNAAPHGYWNLDGTPTWEGHRLQVLAAAILPVDAATLPTGVVQSLDGHAHDFRKPRQISPGTLVPLDHNFCLADRQRAVSPAVRLTGHDGIALEIATTEPGVQVFDAHPIDTGRLATIHGRPYGAHCALALEPQGWPDAPNRPHFPPVALNPGETYRQTTEFRFSGR